MELTGAQKRLLHSTMCDAFPSWSTLARMVHFGLNQSLHSITGGTVPVREAVYDVIPWAMSHDQLTTLLDAALEENATANLRQVIADLQRLSPAPAPDITADLAIVRKRVTELEAQIQMRDAEIAALRAQLAAVPPSAGEVILSSGRQVPVGLLVACLHFVRRVARGSTSMQRTPSGPYENQQVFARRVQREAAALLQELGEAPPDS